MLLSNIKNGLLIALIAVFIPGHQTNNYAELEFLGVACPERDKCTGYRNTLTYIDRNCECDFNCTAYRDCCIDASSNQNSSTQYRPTLPPRNDVMCLNYGDHDHSGVYVINKCSTSWNGPREVRRRCTGPDDFSDPFTAAPATDVAQNKTYRNLACAQCNHANLASLINFQLQLSCDGLTHLTDEQILADITYSEQFKLWGVERLNRFGNETEFIICNFVFDVPEYLNNSVRFCRSNIKSTCAPNWERDSVARQCSEYMAVVYSNTKAYRNPHCAICNNLRVDDVSCSLGVHSRKRPMSFALLLDVNQSDGDQVGMRTVPTPECASGQKYDPFFKKCRQLVCALPGHNVVNGRCVRG